MKKAALEKDDCPIALPTQATLYIRVLHRACQICGGVDKLAARLHVPVATLFRWLEGEAEPPTPIFLKAVDMVMPAWTPEDEMQAQALSAARRKKPID